MIVPSLTSGNGVLWLGDCLELMRHIPDNSVDMVLCDLPYGTTACKWDQVIPFEPLWSHYWRVCKPNAAVVLTASQPFTSALIMSQIDRFKYEWIWRKNRASGHVHAKNKPMKIHENICVFSHGNTLHENQSSKRMTYNPQGLIQKPQVTTRNKKDKGDNAVLSARNSHGPTIQTHEGYPISEIEFAIDGGNAGKDHIHPTQKPVALFEYLIRTYTNEGDLILDNCAGSGTTAIAAHRSNRRWLCIEREPEYYLKAGLRIVAECST